MLNKYKTYKATLYSLLRTKCDNFFFSFNDNDKTIYLFLSNPNTRTQAQPKHPINILNIYVSISIIEDSHWIDVCCNISFQLIT